MSRFAMELRVIPKATWVIAWFAYLCLTVPIFFFVVPGDPEVGKWPRWGQALLIYGVFLLVVAYVALVGYVYGDAKRRRMRYVMWTLLAIFIPNAIGMILYFILRDPLWKPCSGCGKMVNTGLAFCPHCGRSLHPTCPNCAKPIDLTWANCGHCGQRLPVPQDTQNRDLAT